ncbi:hypothetical protein HU200_036270 [Digitaria exilis]|uniref:Carboxypeptidase n=1 Tax=Digitaria exilis TaxID=1010633 RepID=A0A835BFL7_9POAL|nr:hypothetical protein HU200_036270 [Digitaria exilis]
MAAPLWFPFPLLAIVLAAAVSGSAPPAAALVFPKEALPTKSGYLPIPSPNASLYFAFYEATHPVTPPASTPLLVWLDGGPGYSSFLGNFFQIGPYLLSSNTTTSPSTVPLSPNPFAWNRRFGLLFLDSPLGTGYSAAPSVSAIPTNQSTVAEHILAALQSFLAAEPPELRARPLFLTGESYGGKSIPTAGALILAANPRLPVGRRINLRGVAIGDGLVHPVAQVATHAEVAYGMGLIGGAQRREAEAMQREAVALTRAARWREASDARAGILAWLQSATGLPSLYDAEGAAASAFFFFNFIQLFNNIIKKPAQTNIGTR